MKKDANANSDANVMQQLVKTTNNFFIADKHLLTNYTNKNNSGTVKCEHLFCSFIMLDEG